MCFYGIFCVFVEIIFEFQATLDIRYSDVNKEKLRNPLDKLDKL